MTTKQRAALRAMANAIDPILHIGKDGITDNLAKQAWDALEARELVKATVQKNAPMSAREACEALCERVHAEPCAGHRQPLCNLPPGAGKLQNPPGRAGLSDV